MGVPSSRRQHDHPGAGGRVTQHEQRERAQHEHGQAGARPVGRQLAEHRGKPWSCVNQQLLQAAVFEIPAEDAFDGQQVGEQGEDPTPSSCGAIAEPPAPRRLHRRRAASTASTKNTNGLAASVGRRKARQQIAPKQREEYGHGPRRVAGATARRCATARSRNAAAFLPPAFKGLASSVAIDTLTTPVPRRASVAVAHRVARLAQNAAAPMPGA